MTMNLTWFKIMPAVFILFSVFGGSSSFDGLPWGDNNPEEMFPDHLNLFVGEKVQVFGKHLENDITDIKFCIELLGHKCILLNTSVLNSTHAVTILEGTKEIKGRNTLLFYGKRNGKGSPEQLASINIFVQELLQNVTNVSSIWYYSRKLFEVSWELGVNYTQTKYVIDVQTRWVANDKVKNGRYNCTSSDQTSCRLKNYSYQSILFIHIIVKIHNDWWNTYKQNRDYFLQPQVVEFPHYIYEVQPKKDVKTERPTNVEIKERTSRCFNISWTNPAYFLDYGEDAFFHISVITEKLGTVTKQITKESRLAHEKFGEAVPICGLNPNTHYFVTLKLKPVDGGYWSEPAEVWCITLEDRPAFGPPMTKTSFWVGTCNKGKRDIILYWRDLTPLEANGKLTNFHIGFNSKFGEERSSSNNIKVEMACNVTYDVQVYSSTQIGWTDNPSRLTIPSEMDTFSNFPVDLKVEKLNVDAERGLLDVNMTWTFPNKMSAKNVSLIAYFCVGQSFSNKICIDDFQYRVVPIERQFIEIRNISERTDRFGYALEKDRNNLSGISWTDCIYDRREFPNEVNGVSAHPGVIAGSILVVWNAQRCSKDTLALVLGYRLHYCTQLQACSNVSVEGGDTSSHILKDLDTDEIYTIRVSAEAMSGKGPLSKSVTSKPKENGGHDSALPTMVIISCILCVLLVAIPLVFIMRCHRRRKAKMQQHFGYEKFDPVAHKQKVDPHHSDSGISTKTNNSDANPTTMETSGGSREDSDCINPYATIGTDSNETIPSDFLGTKSAGSSHIEDGKRMGKKLIAVDAGNKLQAATRSDESEDMKDGGKDLIGSNNLCFHADDVGKLNNCEAVQIDNKQVSHCKVIRSVSDELPPNIATKALSNEISLPSDTDSYIHAHPVDNEEKCPNHSDSTTDLKTTRLCLKTAGVECDNALTSNTISVSVETSSSFSTQMSYIQVAGLKHCDATTSSESSGNGKSTYVVEDGKGRSERDSVDKDCSIKSQSYAVDQVSDESIPSNDAYIQPCGEGQPQISDVSIPGNDAYVHTCGESQPQISDVSIPGNDAFIQACGEGQPQVSDVSMPSNDAYVQACGEGQPQVSDVSMPSNDAYVRACGIDQPQVSDVSMPTDDAYVQTCGDQPQVSDVSMPSNDAYVRACGIDQPQVSDVSMPTDDAYVQTCGDQPQVSDVSMPSNDAYVRACGVDQPQQLHRI